MKQLIAVACYVFFVGTSLSQTPTLGLTYTSDSVSPGYTLFSFDGGQDVYLINNCGEQVNKWSIPETPGLTSYILENGNILITGKDSLYIKDWNDNLIWTYPTTANNIRQHHDVQPLPNGNILCVVAEFKSVSEQIASGKDPALAVSNFKLDAILELEPIGSNNANIVWEWHFWDHLVQDFDSTKINYGVVADHPELLDINFIGPNEADWTHVNSIHYNEQFDQIMLSARHKSELYVIDHSTSTAEAAGHTGGTSGKGGDFLWRWGNPQVYDQGTALDQKLFMQHDGQWVKQGYPDAGKVTVFNNEGDGSATFSSVHTILPDMNGAGYVLTNNKFGPDDFAFSWNGTVQGDVMFSNKKSGVHALPNGGFLMCESERGRFIEIDSLGNIVWVYRNPQGHPANDIFDQYYTFTNNENSTFRATKYELDYAGFTGQDLTPTGILENLNPLSDSCEASVLSVLNQPEFVSIVNPVTNGIITMNISDFNSIELIDQTGKIVKTWNSFTTDLDVRDLSNGIYLIRVDSLQGTDQQRLLIQQ